MEKAWLREMERAQWEQRPVEAKPAAATRGRHLAAGSAQRPGTRPPSQRGLPQPGALRSSRDGETAHVSAPDDGARNPGSPARSSEPGAKPAATGQAPVEPAAPRRAAMMEATIETRLWGEIRHWERRKALVLERGGRIRVWLRDAELTEESAAETVAWLARLARESGLELEAVTINGCVVFESLETEHGAGTLG
jgi:hypothetical protein